MFIGTVLAANFCQGTVDGKSGYGLPIVKILAVVQLNGILVNRVVKQVHLEEADRDPLVRLLAADQLKTNM